ncbi:MAG: hypothetical protein KZQ73_02360 [Candidatus Thiodiazotropha sp. (ex Semelilucina semeliformis)]|nr:hypothetical protein [Candidatus Thiodiazotropha sp. (ex Myrtea spinifera)]MCU7806699.1 hypothetical protein [Candidatus Thiodiazotropha sp. (ex Semelilucina semeliformis)]MCU7830174.1 hypothetical protein [Candidatus Thiodiazotropha sp. (ex Myrtea sp. 'scaly one' KF741663)]
MSMSRKPRYMSALCTRKRQAMNLAGVHNAACFWLDNKLLKVRVNMTAISLIRSMMQQRIQMVKHNSGIP